MKFADFKWVVFLGALVVAVTATRSPSQYLGAAAEWGTIAPGRRADLVLLRAKSAARYSSDTVD